MRCNQKQPTRALGLQTHMRTNGALAEQSSQSNANPGLEFKKIQHAESAGFGFAVPE